MTQKLKVAVAVAWVAVVVLGIAVFALSDGDDGPAAAGASQTDTDAQPERPAPTDEQIPTDAARQANGQPILPGEVGGDPVRFEGLDLALLRVRDAHPDAADQRVVDVSIRADNPGSAVVALPNVGLSCGGAIHQIFDGPTYDGGAPVPPGSHVDGTLAFTLPADCASPTLVATSVTWADPGDPVVHWPIDQK